jgi:hypothetical protein
MTWFCVVDGQGFVHSVWGKALRQDAERKAAELSAAYLWAGIRVVEVRGEQPHCGQRVKG